MGDSQPSQHSDVLILGAGSAGYACALRTSRPGLSVTLIQGAKVVGGACLRSQGARCRVRRNPRLPVWSASKHLSSRRF
jgi:predicted flavoprotein YhiN